jgi:hypothetical protein
VWRHRAALLAARESLDGGAFENPAEADLAMARMTRADGRAGDDIRVGKRRLGGQATAPFFFAGPSKNLLQDGLSAAKPIAGCAGRKRP